MDWMKFSIYVAMKWLSLVLRLLMKSRLERILLFFSNLEVILRREEDEGSGVLEENLVMVGI